MKLHDEDIGSIAKAMDVPEWQVHVMWSINNQDNGGSVDCIQKYLEYGMAGCIVAGGRRCVMRYAIDRAKKADYSEAMKMTLLTQCHNQRAADLIRAVGEVELGQFLKVQSAIGI